MNQIVKWTANWKIKFNKLKSTYVIFTLRYVDLNQRIHMNNQQILQGNLAKYLGILILCGTPALDARLTWNHLQKKAEQIRIKIYQMYWLIRRKSHNWIFTKRLIYFMVIRLYGHMRSNYEDALRILIKWLYNTTNPKRNHTHNLYNARWYRNIMNLHTDLNIHCGYWGCSYA